MWKWTASSTGLAGMIETVQVGRWLNELNSTCDASTPMQVVMHGEKDLIWRVLYDLESGQSG